MVTEGDKKARVSEWVVTEGVKKAQVSEAHECFFTALGDHPFAHECFFTALCDHPWNLFYNIQWVMKFLIALLNCRPIANINPRVLLSLEMELVRTSRSWIRGVLQCGSWLAAFCWKVAWFWPWLPKFVGKFFIAENDSLMARKHFRKGWFFWKFEY